MQPGRGGMADRAETLEGHAPSCESDACGGLVHDLGYPVPGDAQLVVGYPAELVRSADCCTAVAQLIVDDCRVVFRQAHVQSEDVLGGTSLLSRRTKARRISSLYGELRIGLDTGLGAAVEQVDAGPLPGHHPGQPGDLLDGYVGLHAGAALADATGGVVDDQHALHSGLGVADRDDLFRSPLVHHVEHTSSLDTPCVLAAT